MDSRNYGVKGGNTFDLAIIGGGVNGTAIARDAAGRGYSCVLFERGDLASATSSASTKLIHGGLRYLEYGELRLVRKALAEREVLLRSAPHIISPMRFVLPLSQHTRSRRMVGLGLALYDHLARRDVLPDSAALDLTTDDVGKPLFANYREGFVYSDCWVDDARMVVLQAMDAARNGAHIHTRAGVRDLTAHDGMWEVETDKNQRYRARMVVNAAGPWVRQLLDHNGLAGPMAPRVRLVRGSHIIVPRIFEGAQAYLLQQPDDRVVFAISYEDKFTLIGTTDVDHGTNADAPATCTRDEAEYLCDAANRFFQSQILPQHIVATYSGVRPLFDDGKGKAAAVTRDYHLYRHRHENAPMLSVYGGKITTARALAEHACDLLAKDLGPRAGAWTATAKFPGGDMIDGNLDDYIDDLAAIYHWLEAETLLRMAKAYGTLTTRILRNAQKPSDLGRDFGGGLYEAEVEYLRHNEWAMTAEDILWRRSKLSLHVAPETVAALKQYLGEA